MFVIKSVVLLSTHCGHLYHQMCHKQTPSSKIKRPAKETENDQRRILLTVKYENIVFSHFPQYLMSCLLRARHAMGDRNVKRAERV